VKVALMGASGFVGTRMVEMFHLGGLGEIRPIVRSFGSLARLARFDLECKMADALDELALEEAFAGCNFVVHAVHGQLDVVKESISPSYRAACKAGVNRFVYLSSASVHGQAPMPGTDERSPLSDRQPQQYNNLKVGPRDRWISGIANEMRRGTSYLVEGGDGICNSIYVDNLVHAIQLALMADGADRETFLVGDTETVTWAEITPPHLSRQIEARRQSGH
jgi:nucleoside-diphosphate-sugar epimerase